MQLFKQFIALLVPLMSLCVHAQDSTVQINKLQAEESIVKFYYDGKGKFYSNADGATSEGVIVRLYGKYEESPIKNIKLSFLGGFRFESDRSQDFFVDSNSGNRIDLEYALVEWMPLESVLIQAGAIDQHRTFKRETLMGLGSTFPGAVQNFKFYYNKLDYGLKLEQAIPTSRTYSTKVVESEPTPSLFVEDLYFNYRLSSQSELSLNLGYFAFYDLPSKVAEDSALHGNIVARQGPNDSYFVYPFQGWSITSSYKNHFSNKYGYEIKYEYLNNIKAPSKQAQANSLLFKLIKHNVSSQTDYIMYLFEQERQAAPSYYLQDLYGYSNRVGWGVKAKHTFEKNNFFIGFSWVESQIIEITPEQSDQRTIQIYLGVDNA